MGENAYRLYKAILLTVLAAAVLIIGRRYAENGGGIKGRTLYRCAFRRFLRAG